MLLKETSINEGVLSAVIRGNVLYGDKKHSVKNGELTITINEKECDDCPTKATWIVADLNVTKRKNKYIIPEKFTIPKSIILTKID